MKIVNVMNFARQFDPRFDNSESFIFEATKRELDIVNGYEIDNTFLLQYDAVIDSSYINLFKNHSTGHTEIGLWYEIVQPLCENSGIEWRGEYAWDWHIVPGFSMAYTAEEREKLADVVMNDFKKIYGYYPSKYNCFTPAQTIDNTVKTPVFRLLGPDLVHNYDNDKYLGTYTEGMNNVFTLEAAHPMANKTEFVD